jgi:excisionase family DNA binding protein
MQLRYYLIMALAELFILAERARSDPGWLSLGQAAAVMGVSPATVHRWAASGRLDTLRKGRKVYYSAASCLREAVPGWPEPPCPSKSVNKKAVV